MENSGSPIESHVWVSIDVISLLDDHHIYVSQRLLLKQFPSIKGLNSTLVYHSIRKFCPNFTYLWRSLDYSKYDAWLAGC